MVRVWELGLWGLGFMRVWALGDAGRGVSGIPILKARNPYSHSTFTVLYPTWSDSVVPPLLYSSHSTFTQAIPPLLYYIPRGQITLRRRLLVSAEIISLFSMHAVFLATCKLKMHNEFIGQFPNRLVLLANLMLQVRLRLGFRVQTLDLNLIFVQRRGFHANFRSYFSLSDSLCLWT